MSSARQAAFAAASARQARLPPAMEEAVAGVFTGPLELSVSGGFPVSDEEVSAVSQSLGIRDLATRDTLANRKLKIEYRKWA